MRIKQTTRFLLAPLLAICCLMTTSLAGAVDWNDPFAIDALAPSSVLGALQKSPCSEGDIQSPLGIADVIDRVLCSNPKSLEAWASARFQAAQTGTARAAFLPEINATGALARNWNATAGQSESFNSLAATLNLSYLLYDFGGRDAALENARQLFESASATHDNVVQGLFMAAIQGYYQVHATTAALESAREAERASQASLDAATARYKVGVATPADRLQAQTAYSQAVLNRIRAGGEQQNARGTLANLMGMSPTISYTLQPPGNAISHEQFEADIGQLITEARRRRPDLAAAEAQFRAAQASIDVAEAAGKPKFSVTTSLGLQDRQFADTTRSGAIGLNVTIPLFTGFYDTYNIRSAQAQADARKASRDSISLQIGLDVWTAYQNLQTETQALITSRDLVASATQNAEVALGRYKAGVGNIIDTITAQSALASARAQQIQSTFNWDVARAALAYAMGQLDDSRTFASAPSQPSAEAIQ